MKHITLAILTGLTVALHAQEPKVASTAAAAAPADAADATSPEIAGLQQAAADFVIAFNKKDAAAIAALFTEAGEMSDLKAEEIISGRAEIQAHYEDILKAPDAPSVAIEVDSVRLVAPDLAIEDGTIHFTPPGDDEPARSSAYTAVIKKNAAGAWQIASTRSLADATDATGQLADLADSMKGDWTSQKGEVRLDLAIGWHESGNYLAGKMLSTKPDATPLTTTIRVGWDAARKTITAWMFDEEGGFAKADWTPTENGWQIRTEGTTAEGESMSANQRVVFTSDDTFTWSAKDRLINGESQPDTELRVVRQAPEPAAK